MTDLPRKFWDYYFDEEYQKLVHLSEELLSKNEQSQQNRILLESINNYAKACDLWEKSYNFPKIIELLDISIDTMQTAEKSSSIQDLSLGVIAMAEINKSAVMVENAMIFNNPNEMKNHAQIGQTIAKNALDQIGQGFDLVENMAELIESYHDYIQAYGKYADVFVQYHNRGEFEKTYDNCIKYLHEKIEEMLENEDRITSSELKGLLANLEHMYTAWTSGKPRLHINHSQHQLSTSFYSGHTFSNYLLDHFGDKSASEISKILFDNKIEIESGGIDGLDDFLQTSIGEEYADVLHLILPGGFIKLLNQSYEFSIHFQIRRFGAGTLVIELELENLTVSDFRMIQTIIGPQAGITDIEFQGNKYQKLDEINYYIYTLLRDFEITWLKDNSTQVIDFLTMQSANYDSDRTWFSRSVIHDISLIYPDHEIKVKDYKQLQESFDFKALNTPLLEGRPSLNDWIQIPDPDFVNLAEIRLHSEDLILFDTHTLVIFLPSKPDFILQGVLSTGLLINDISTLINSFDVMAENVRSQLINQVNHAKIMLEKVEIDQIKSDLKLLRRNVIEVTEFELRALQSIQLLKSQSTIKYPDHAKFVLKLIERSTISSTISSLEQKISIIKESQEGILRTADDLVAKYQEEVSESQQRLVRVITLIGAGVAQITIIDDILAVFQSQGLINTSSADTVKLMVIILAFLLSGIAISWLGWGYLKSKRNLFE